MDNVRYHYSVDVKNGCEQKNIINPIENVFVTIKIRYSTNRPFASTNTMIREYVGKVITNMNDDPDITH